MYLLCLCLHTAAGYRPKANTNNDKKKKKKNSAFDWSAEKVREMSGRIRNG